MSAAGHVPDIRFSPDCLLFFIDETGHEDLSDPNYPVFGIGGCAVMSGAMNRDLIRPWRELKQQHFGSANFQLHAAALRNPSPEQLEALGSFFHQQPIARFAATVSTGTRIPMGTVPYQFLPEVLRRSWASITSSLVTPPTEIALLHEASERGDKLVERYFGFTAAEIEGKRLPVQHIFLSKAHKHEGLEVADFVVHAAGRQCLHRQRGRSGYRKDFEAVFVTDAAWARCFDAHEFAFQ